VWVYEKSVKIPNSEARPGKDAENGYFGSFCQMADSMILEGELALREGECNESISLCEEWPVSLALRISRQDCILCGVATSRATQARDFAAKNLTAAFNLMKEASTMSL